MRPITDRVLDIPRQALDVLDRNRVDGRRVHLHGRRAMIEINGSGPSGMPDRKRLVDAVEALPGVEWAAVNTSLCRLVAALDDPAPELSELVAAIDEVERDCAAEHAGLATDDEPPPPAASTPAGSPIDRSGVERAALTLAITGAGMVVSGAGAVLRRAPLATEAAALISVVDHQPRVRRALEATVGRPATDLGLAALSALGQGLSGGRTGLVVDAAHRVAALGESRAARTAWDDRAQDWLATPEHVECDLVGTERVRPLPDGPVERYADRAGLAGLGALGLGLPLTGSPRRAARLALAGVPKAARMAREAFAAAFGRVLARRGAVVLDPAALRLLDRVDAVVLDARVLTTGDLIVGDVLAPSGGEVGDAASALHELFRPQDPEAVVLDDGWQLGPLADGDIGRDERERIERAGALYVLGLHRDGELLLVAGVIEEPSESVAALAAAAHRVQARLVVTDPDGETPLEAVHRLQDDGAVALVVSGDGAALGRADVGVGVDTADGRAPWGAHVLVGRDLELAALVIEASGAAAATSRRGVQLAQAGSVLGGVGVLIDRPVRFGSGNGRTASVAVDTAAAAAVAWGTWSARQVGMRPITPPVSRVPWHTMPGELVLDRLDVTADGLSTAAARHRRRLVGAEAPSPGLARAVLQELDNPLTPILAGGAALSAAVGSATDAGIVLGVGAFGALVGGMQRLKGERSVAALMASSAVRARVLRDGCPGELAAEELVDGDVVELHAGDVVPADCRLLEEDGLQIDEAALTGEPFPVAKRTDPVIASNVADRTCMLYEGTSVAAGRGRAVVVATGTSTEAGRSMAATQGVAPPTGVERRLESITRQTLPIALGSAGALVASGLLRGRPMRESIASGVSLAVASVPEGLPFLVNAAQMSSAKRLSTQGALVRNPRTIEALGRVDTLCFDKTGTLTEGTIELVAVDDTAKTTPLDALTKRHRTILTAGLRATPEPEDDQPLAHLTDRAVTDGAHDADVTRGACRVLDTLPFEPSRGFHATLADVEGKGVLLSVKGAPETVLPLSTHTFRNGKRVALDARHRRRLCARATTLAEQGYRVLTVAERTADPDTELTDDDVTGLTLFGFLALSDPVRPAAARSVAGLRRAGVQIVMITGDHAGTAETIARRLDVLDGGSVITGPELDDLDDTELDEVLPGVTVVARGTPAHKVRVVEAFRRIGRTVAMTGDGANDAPAIRLADVGIALGRRATPAARAAADLVVTDDRLETILAALVEGRGMWVAVREALGILVGGNLGEIGFTVLGSALTGKSPLNTRQLLLVNLLTDLAPALAIALRAPSPAASAALVTEGPEASLGSALTRDITQRAVTTAAAAAGAWGLARVTGRERRAETVGLAALVGGQLGQTLAVGGLSPAVVASSVGSAAVLAAVVQTPGLSQFFGCTPLGPVAWTIAGGAATAATASALLVPLLSSGDAVTDDDPTPSALPAALLGERSAIGG